MHKFAWLVCGLILSVNLFGGCGYTTKGFAYKEDRIVIFPIQNIMEITDIEQRSSGTFSYPMLLEKKLTNKVIAGFNSEGHLRVTNSDPQALKLKCAVVDYNKESLRYSSDNNVTEQRLWLKVNVKLFDSSDVLLFDKDAIGEASYFTTGPKAKSELQAQEELIKNTAESVLETVTEEW